MCLAGLFLSLVDKVFMVGSGRSCLERDTLRMHTFLLRRQAVERDTEQGEGRSPRVANTKGFCNTEWAENAVLYTRLETRHLGACGDSSFGRDISVFTVEKNHSVGREELCSRFELSTDRFRNK